jgi:predicted alpha/beta-fold hydrolase
MDTWKYLDLVVDAVRARRPGPLSALGWSMGGTMLLKFVAARPDIPLSAAVSVNSPVWASGSATALEKTLRSRLFNFAIATNVKCYLLAHRFSGEPEFAAALKECGMSWWKALTAKSLRDFERAVICPLHGYASEEEYYAANCPRIENLNRVMCQPW